MATISFVPFFQHFTTCNNARNEFLPRNAFYDNLPRSSLARATSQTRLGANVKVYILNGIPYLPESTSAEKLEDLVLVGHGVEDFVLHQMIIPVALGIATAATSVGRIGHLLTVRRHARLLAAVLLLLLLLLQLLLLRLGMMRHYSTHHMRIGGMDRQAFTITLSRPSFSLREGYDLYIQKSFYIPSPR